MFRFHFRRPKWNEDTTAEELQTKEKEEFLAWRRDLALFQEDTGLLLTPYEKNLDFWRQLWRVVERRSVQSVAAFFNLVI